ncbi:hypothetical protein [Tsukamurella strandjordii]|uniref:hypothetical protein n=1 Tax=Tsukamurella strandjordii TaxID=147577 RepID=UPI0031D6AE85
MYRLPRTLGLAIAATLAVTVPVGTAAAAPTAPPAPAPSAPSPSTAPAGSSASAPAAVAGVVPGVNPADIQCPLGWPKPKEKGGLASLILLAPAAGAFTDEAFAAGQAYDPILSLFGPFLAALAPEITKAQPALAGPVGALNGAEQAVYDAIKPWYAQYRPKVIDALTKAGNDLAPVLQEMVATPLGACFVAWEAQVLTGLQTGRWSPIVFSGLGELAELARSGKGGGPVTGSPTDPKSGPKNDPKAAPTTSARPSGPSSSVAKPPAAAPTTGSVAAVKPSPRPVPAPVVVAKPR